MTIWVCCSDLLGHEVETRNIELIPNPAQTISTQWLASCLELRRDTKEILMAMYTQT